MVSVDPIQKGQSVPVSASTQLTCSYEVREAGARHLVSLVVFDQNPGAHCCPIGEPRACGAGRGGKR